MNYIARVAVLIVAATVSLLPAAAAADDHLLFAGGRWVIARIVAPGETTCPGGPCDGTRPVHIRGQQFVMVGGFDGPVAYLFGNEFVITMNCNFDSAMAGPCWGTFRASSLEGEMWQGVWSGRLDFLNLTGRYHAVGHGDGGRLDRLTFTLDAVLPGDQPYPYVVSMVRVIMPGLE